MIDLKVKALVSFAGLVTMGVGETKDINDKVVLNDLIKAKFVEPVKSTRKKANADESK